MRGAHDVRAHFDERADEYGTGGWHADYAAGLVAALTIEATDTVVDAGAGTGTASTAIAARLDPEGRVLAVDLSQRMLRHGRFETRPTGPVVAPIVADATALPLSDASVDVVVGSASLLYMPVARALGEWRRVLRPGGRVGFSTMREGHPPAARLFRRLAREYGVELGDAAAGSGSETACVAALSSAGFGDVVIHSGTVRMGRADLEHSWTVHARLHREHLQARLDSNLLRHFEFAYRAALDSRHLDMAAVEVLYATAVRP
ncbi:MULTISPECIES: class I SAM-dependent methyltransferase [Nocardia]|uniref:class I SAM-dependent methyltransferase n=1 Tax=Nocardia TaxID=1817 RepID=UPI000D688191|nr:MULTISPECIES: class I SAM-dependent methyltransferase [Nocardia]